MSSPAANPNAQLYRGHFAATLQLNADTWFYRITLESADATRFRFAPGQFVQLKAKADPHGLSRAYSIASAPSTLPNLDFCIKHYPGGVLSGYLATVQVGDPVLLRAPFGRFTLSLPSHKESAASAPQRYVFIATGTGLAPVRSMLLALYEHEPEAHAKLYQGARQLDGLFFKKEIEELQKEHPHFSFVHTCSQPDATWKGETRYVSVLLSGDGIDPAALYFVCGNPAMVRDVSILLRRHHVPLNHIRVEKW